MKKEFDVRVTVFCPENLSQNFYDPQEFGISCQFPPQTHYQDITGEEITNLKAAKSLLADFDISMQFISDKKIFNSLEASRVYEYKGKNEIDMINSIISIPYTYKGIHIDLRIDDQSTQCFYTLDPPQTAPQKEKLCSM